MVESPTRKMRAARSRYRPAEELGHGATATVWRARDTRTGRDVALKRFHPHVLSDPAARRRVVEEAAAAARVSHPNIVSALDLIDDDGLALVFPYVEGGTLADRLSAGPPIAPREAASIALAIADALTVAHEAGVVHRDVKPANILLGADGQARLFDFGISRAIEDADPDHRLTGAGLAIGTLPYMAPEQLAAEPVTKASDVYGLGAVLYEMLAGRRPYAAESPVALAREQGHPPPQIPAAPQPLADLAIAALTMDASRRPDANQMARGLRAWLDNRVEADAPTEAVLAAAPVVAASPVVAAAPAVEARTKPRRMLPVRGLVALAMAGLVLVAAVPFAAGWLSRANTDAGSQSAVLALAQPTPSPTAVTPTPPPVAPVADAHVPTPPHGGSGKGHHHKHHHHKHHKHGD